MDHRGKKDREGKGGVRVLLCGFRRVSESLVSTPEVSSGVSKPQNLSSLPVVILFSWTGPGEPNLESIDWDSWEGTVSGRKWTSTIAVVLRIQGTKVPEDLPSLF